MAKVENYEAFVVWCKENEYNPAERESRKAFEAAHKPGSTGRKNQARKAVLVAIGETSEGAKLFRKATCEYRDRHAAADLLRWEMTTKDSCDRVSFIIGDELDAAE